MRAAGESGGRFSITLLMDATGTSVAGGICGGCGAGAGGAGAAADGAVAAGCGGAGGELRLQALRRKTARSAAIGRTRDLMRRNPIHRIACSIRKRPGGINSAGAAICNSFRVRAQGLAFHPAVFPRPEPARPVLPAVLLHPALPAHPVRALERHRLPARLARPAHLVRGLLRGPLYCRCPAQDCSGCTQPELTSQPKR